MRHRVCVFDGYVVVSCPFYRHRVEFFHSTFTGKRILKLDGRQIHKVSAKYKLTGLIKFKINDHHVSLSIDPAGVGGLMCTCARFAPSALLCLCLCLRPLVVGSSHAAQTR